MVTGTPRSGTTPVGDALAAASGVRTLYEPLNAHVGDRRVQRYFEVPGACGFTEQAVDELVRDLRGPRLRLRPGVFPEDRGLRRLAKYVTGSRTRMTYRQCRLDPRLRTIVWKDPFAAFLAEQLATRHDIPVVVAIRPPHAVAASFKRLGWGFDVTDLIRRLGDDGQGYEGLLAQVDTRTPVGNAAVLWHVVNDTLMRASTRTSRIHLLDLDRVVADRQRVFRELYDRLELAWDGAVERHLARTGSGQGPAQPDTDRAHTTDRDPAAVNRYWVDVLDPDEVAAVEAVDGELWEQLRGVA